MSSGERRESMAITEQRSVGMGWRLSSLYRSCWALGRLEVSSWTTEVLVETYVFTRHRGRSTFQLKYPFIREMASAQGAGAVQMGVAARGAEGDAAVVAGAVGEVVVEEGVVGSRC